LDKAKGASDEPEPEQAAASFPETQAFFGIAIKGPINAAPPETHPYFGMWFRVPDSHTFWRNPTLGCESG